MPEQGGREGTSVGQSWVLHGGRPDKLGMEDGNE